MEANLSSVELIKKELRRENAFRETRKEIAVGKVYAGVVYAEVE